MTEDGVATMYKMDDEGNPYGPAIASKDVPVFAEVEWNSTKYSGTYCWTYNETTDTYTSNNHGLNSSFSYLCINVKTAGQVEINWTVHSENNSDKLTIKRVSTYSQTDNWVYQKSGYDQNIGRGEAYPNKGTILKDVEVGDYIEAVYQKDGSVNKYADEATVNFSKSPVFTAATFNSVGGSAVGPMFIKNGVIDGELPTPTKEGKYFEGWFTEPTYENKVAADTVLSGNVTLYAKWSDPVSFTAHINDGVSEDVVSSFQQGTVPTLPADPTREGFYFLGWYTSATEFTAENKYTPAATTEAVEVYARWLAVEDAHVMFGSWKGFKVKLSGSSASPTTSNVAFDVDVVGNYSWQTAWNRDYDMKGTIDSIDEATGVTTLSGTNGVAAIWKITDDFAIINTKSDWSDYVGFVFRGQEANSTTGVSVGMANSGKVAFVTLPIDGVSTTVLIDRTGADTVITVGVTATDFKGTALDLKNISKSFGFTVTKGESTIATFGAKADNTFTKELDGFQGQYTKVTKTLIVSGAGLWIDSDASSSLTKSTSATYTVEDAENNKLFVKYSSSVRAYVTLDKENSSFTKRDATVKATFEAGYTDGGSQEFDVKRSLTTWFSAISGLTTPTRDGYRFDGWYDAAGNKVENVTEDASATNVTYTAHWVKTWTVSFKEANGDAISGVTDIVLDTNTAISQLPSPTKDGAFFDGWFTDPELNTAFDPTTLISADTVLYAKWTAPLTITIYLNDGVTTEPTTQSSQYNRVPSVATPSMDGKFFGGWFTDAELTQPWDSSSVLTADVTIYAKWVDAPAYIGSYVGYNCCGAKYGAEVSLSSYYDAAIGFDKKCSGKFGSSTVTGNKATDVVDGIISSADGCKAVYLEEGNCVVIISHYGGWKTSDPLTGGDYSFNVKGTSSTVVIKQATFVSSKYYALEVTVDGTAHNVFIDAASSKAYIGVSFEVTGGTVDGFAGIFPSGDKTATGLTVAVKDGNGSTLKAFTGSASGYALAA